MAPDSSRSSALLCVHGLAGQRQDWDGVLRALEPELEAVAIDLPGHGGFEAVTASGLVGCVELVHEAVRSLESGSVILMGHSIGCSVVLEAQRKCPRRVAGLVLVEGNLLAEGDADSAVEAFGSQLGAVGTRSFLREAFTRMLELTGSETLRASVLERLELLDERVARTLVLDAVRWSAQRAASTLEELSVPVLVLQSTALDSSGRWSRLQPGETTPWTRLVGNRARHAEVHLWQGFGHFLPQEAAPLVAASVREFAKRLRA